MCNKITGFFKKLSLSKLPVSVNDCESCSSQESLASDPVISEEHQNNSPIVTSFISSSIIDISSIPVTFSKKTPPWAFPVTFSKQTPLIDF